MIFNKSGRKLKGYSFFYGQQSVGQASKDFCMQNIALHAFFDSRSVAHRKEPDGLNMIPKYLYSEASYRLLSIEKRNAKYMLGVHKSATNIAVLAELGLYPLSIAALKSSVIYWIHLLNSKCNSLIFHAYRVNLKLNESLIYVHIVRQ
jgi:hypothetical protein